MTIALTFPSTSSVLHDSPIGRLRIESRGSSISQLDILSDDAIPPVDVPLDFRSGIADQARDAPAIEVLDESRRQLDEYFAGVRKQFDIPLDQLGTMFHNEVWQALLEVSWGTATSYGMLADQTGRPTGARAVGGAIRANRIALLVPCHRVLGSGRRLTGYSPGNGVTTKKWLLDHEGIDYVG